MILNESNATPFDLRFRLFGTHVRVHPLFWVFSAVLGWRPNVGLAEVAIWVACVFVSILLHEFGHIWMGRLFGSDGHIVLQAMGGLAVGSNALDGSGRRILVSAAGPAIQLMLSGILWMSLRAGVFAESPVMVQLALVFLLFINFWWALINLLPVYPLDGGMIAREVCCQASPHKGLLVSLWVSLLVSAVLALNALAGMKQKDFLPPVMGYTIAPTGMWVAILFAMFAAGSWQAIQAERQSSRTYRDDDALPWER